MLADEIAVGAPLPSLQAVAICERFFKEVEHWLCFGNHEEATDLPIEAMNNTRACGVLADTSDGRVSLHEPINESRLIARSAWVDDEPDGFVQNDPIG